MGRYLTTNTAAPDSECPPTLGFSPRSQALLGTAYPRSSASPREPTDPRRRSIRHKGITPRHPSTFSGMRRSGASGIGVPKRSLGSRGRTGGWLLLPLPSCSADLLLRVAQPASSRIPLKKSPSFRMISTTGVRDCGEVFPRAIVRTERIGPHGCRFWDASGPVSAWNLQSRFSTRFLQASGDCQ